MRIENCYFSCDSGQDRHVIGYVSFVHFVAYCVFSTMTIAWIFGFGTQISIINIFTMTNFQSLCFVHTKHVSLALNSSRYVN